MILKLTFFNFFKKYYIYISKSAPTKHLFFFFEVDMVCIYFPQSIIMLFFSGVFILHFHSIPAIYLLYNSIQRAVCEQRRLYLSIQNYSFIRNFTFGSKSKPPTCTCQIIVLQFSSTRLVFFSGDQNFYLALKS